MVWGGKVCARKHDGTEAFGLVGAIFGQQPPRSPS